MCLGQLKKRYSVYVDITLDKSEKVHLLARIWILVKVYIMAKTWGKQEQENKSIVIWYLDIIK